MGKLTVRELVHALLFKLQEDTCNLRSKRKDERTIPGSTVREKISDVRRESGDRHGDEEVEKALIGRGFAFIRNPKGRCLFVFSPIIVEKAKDGSNIIFINNSHCQEYCSVCEVCERGFADIGFEDHLNKAANHLKQIQEEVNRITRRDAGDGKDEYVCPMPQCDYTCASKADAELHLEQKLKRVNLKTMEVTKIDRPVPFCCDICHVELPAAQKNVHNKSRQHQLKLEEMKKDKNEVEVLINNQKAGNGFTIQMKDDVETINFCIKNLSQTSSVTLTECRPRQNYDGVTLPGDTLEIAAEGEKTVGMRYVPRCVQSQVLHFFFHFKGEQSGEFSILREVMIVEENDATNPRDKPKQDEGKTASTKLKLVQSDLLPKYEETDQLTAIDKLDAYLIPHELRKCLSTQHPEKNLPEELRLDELTFENYARHFSKLLHMEEYQMDRDIKYYSMKDTQMKKVGESELLTLQVPGLEDKRPSLLKGDRLLAIPSVPDGKKYEGCVDSVQKKGVTLGFHKRFRNSFSEDQRYNIEFRVSRMVLRVVHRAVSRAGACEQCSLKDVLFPTRGTGKRPEIRNLEKPLKYMTEEINKEQKSAVEHILRGTSRPAPYLIYGPPGTGKTTTMVEAIKQVYDEIPESKILACAPQNSSADLITERLIEHERHLVKQDEILRLNAKSRACDNIKEHVKAVSNYKETEAYFPNIVELKRYRIIVATLSTSGRLVSGKIGNHFTHIFIDEAGQATEPLTVIPLAGLLDVDKENGGQVVLAGDPKQLGPVIRSSLASKELGTSLLERLMDRDLYQPNGRGYNPEYETKLVQSFRSHKQILKVPNECFYDNELEPCLAAEMANKFCKWKELPTEDFPLIFHGVSGEEAKGENSHSWYNMEEVAIVVDYVNKLKETKVESEQIGIISPYLEQVKKISNALPESGVKVGSVERFQGDEREVIIISTVRSPKANSTQDKQTRLGFVSEAKRFNVAVTRAKALLIVVGDPAILATNENWKKLIRHIRDGGGYTGCSLPPDFDNDGEKKSTEQLSVSPDESTHAQESLDLSKGSQLLQERDDTWTSMED